MWELRIGSVAKPGSDQPGNGKAKRDGNGTTDADIDGPGHGTTDADRDEHARRFLD